MPSQVMEIVVWAASVIFMSGIYVTKIRALEADVEKNAADIKAEAANSHAGRAELWKAWQNGPPAVLAHLESIEKNQARQERTVEQMAQAFLELQTTIIEKLTNRS